MEKIINADVFDGLLQIESESIDCIVTSPPYYQMRDYKIDGQIGLEKSLKEYLRKLLSVTAELKRVLKPTGTLFWNHGDGYGTGSAAGDRKGSKQSTVRGGTEWYEATGKPPLKGFEKSLILQNWRLAISMIDQQGWKLRNAIIWHKINSMPTSVLDRLGNKYEPVFFFSKSNKYYFDLDTIRVPYTSDEPRNFGVVRARDKGYNTKLGTKRREEEEEARRLGLRRPPSNDDYTRNPKGKNPGDVWPLTLQPHKERHIAMFPEKLIMPMIMAGCPEKEMSCNKCGVVLGYCNGTKTLYKLQDVWNQMSKVQLEETSPFLREALQFFVGSQEPSYDKRMDNNHKGVQVDNEERPPCVEQGRICAGTQNSYGGDTETIFDGERGGSSYQRKQTRQQRNKPALDDQTGTRQDDKVRKKSGSYSVSSLWKENKSVFACPKCGGDVGIRRGVVLDCFSGAGTTGVVCKRLRRNFIGIELNPQYVEIARQRITDVPWSFDI